MIVYRPLLDFKKSELLKYCKKTWTPFAIDKSNFEDKYERNKIRHEIVQPMRDSERQVVINEIEKKNKIKQEINQENIEQNYKLL